MAGRGARLQRRHVPTQRRGGGDAEDEVDPRRAAEVQHLGRAEVAVGTDEDLYARPVTADRAHGVAEKAARLGAGGATCRAQHDGDGPALAVERHEGLEAVFVVGVEETLLLPGMHRVEGVVEVEHDAARSWLKLAR